MPQVVLLAIGLVVTLVCILPALHSLLIDCGDTDFRSSNYFSTSGGLCVGALHCGAMVRGC